MNISFKILVFLSKQNLIIVYISQVDFGSFFQAFFLLSVQKIGSAFFSFPLFSFVQISLNADLCMSLSNFFFFLVSCQNRRTFSLGSLTSFSILFVGNFFSFLHIRNFLVKKVRYTDPKKSRTVTKFGTFGTQAYKEYFRFG